MLKNHPGFHDFECTCGYNTLNALRALEHVAKLHCSPQQVFEQRVKVMITPNPLPEKKENINV